MARRTTSDRVTAHWRAFLVALCASLALVVGACGGDDEGGGGGGGDGGTTEKVDVQAELQKKSTLTVWAWTPGTEEAARMFEKAHPNVTVKLQNVGQGPPHYRKVRTVLQSGKGLPDVIHMEFQFLPSFTLTEDLADLTPYLPDDFLSNYPEWVQKQINLDGGIYGIPWDTGPMGFIYRKDLVEKAGIKTPIETWDEFADAAVKYHEANPDSYLINMPGGQTGQWLGLFWQAGAQPFTSDPNNLRIDLTSAEIKKVTEYWDRLYETGAISHDADFTDAWYQGFARGKYAGWLSAAWGPIFLQSYTENSKGKWQAQQLPQWNAGETVSGNWGGSTLAVLDKSDNKAVAAEFARWILTEQKPVEMFMYDRFLFPPQNFMLESDEWLNQEYEFYGGQQVNKVYAEMSEAVNTDWQWNPIHEFVATTGDEIKARSVDQGQGATAALQPWQDAVVQYAEQQGLTVQGGGGE